MHPHSFRRLFPFLRWPRPSTETLRRDAWAGITVGLVLVPQSLAYATLAGMPAHTGLYAALLPALIGVLWGSSALLSVGPVALTSLLVYGALAPMAQPGSGQWVTLAIWLGLYTGLIQFALGAFRLGGIVNLVSQPVMLGFVNAAAAIIILTQLPALFGIDLSFDGTAGAIEQLSAVAEHPIVPLFGLCAIALLFALRRFLPRLPAVLIVSVVGIVASSLIGYAEAGGTVIGAIPAGLPPLVLPSELPFESHRQLWPAAAILALISFTEAMSSCRILARKTNTEWNENQELIGQGMAKFASAFSGAFPVSGSFSRSALNLYSGAVSAWSSLFTVATVLVCLLFLTAYLHDLPKSVLAAIIVVPVLSLFEPRAFRRLFSYSRRDGAIAVATFITTLIALPHLYWGIVVGVGLTMVSFLYARMQPRIVEVSLHEDRTLRDRQRFDLPPLAPDLLAVRMDSALNFLSGTALERFILARAHEHGPVRRVLLCAGAINDIDASGVDTLESLLTGLRQRGVTLYLSNVKKQVWEVLERAGVPSDMGREHIFSTDLQAVAALAADCSRT